MMRVLPTSTEMGALSASGAVSWSARLPAPELVPVPSSLTPVPVEPMMLPPRCVAVLRPPVSSAEEDEVTWRLAAASVPPPGSWVVPVEVGS